MNDIQTITICICTFKRPQMLERLLDRLSKQETQNRFKISVVVVDNDSNRSAWPAVNKYGHQTDGVIEYYNEPQQNIALARNKAIAHARGAFVALIDDDEWPDYNWLGLLYDHILLYNADGILGPVLPYFDSLPPDWVIKAKIFDRPTHQTGHVMEWYHTRTGNTLLKKAIFANNQEWFNPSFGSGGEDRDFFKRKIQEGFTFIWCQEARVFESIPPRRWRRTVLIKRALLRGKMAVQTSNHNLISMCRSIIAILIYTAMLPFLIILGHHQFMKYLIRGCDHLGKVLSYIGLDVVKEKYIQ